MIYLGFILAVITADHVVHDLEHKGPRDWSFDARLIEPANERSGLTVVMIGGGISNDLDWTTPGKIKVGEDSMQLTITGESHKDATTIAIALADQGHAVLHYSTIADEDPKRDLWPLEVTPHAPRDLLLLQKSATELARKHPATSNDRLILLAHSMGAQRAAAQAAKDEQIHAMVLMGAAQMTHTGPEDPGRNLNAAAARSRLQELDQDDDGKVMGEELPEDLDFDLDGILQAWEMSAAIAITERGKISAAPRTDQHGIPFGEESLKGRSLPVLVIYGQLDNAQGHHAPVLQSLVDQEHLRQLEIRIIPNLGHQMSPQEGMLVGPISSGAIQGIVEWIGDLGQADDSPSTRD